MEQPAALARAYDPEQMRQWQQQGRFCWLDLENPSAQTLQAMAEQWGWHEMLLRDLQHRGQRPKLDEYSDCALLVFYGLDDSSSPSQLQEVHLVISGDYVITVHQGAPVALRQLHQRLTQAQQSESYLIYRLLNGLTDSFFPVLERIDGDIDQLEDDILGDPQEEHLARLFDLKHELVAIRRIAGPQRDLAARALEELEQIPGLENDQRDWYRDVYDHMLRVSESVNDYRDLLAGVMDIYLSTVSNRLNVVMKQLTIMASICLPLTLLTGFFGMNFPWLVGHLGGGWTFLSLGVGSMLISAVLLWVLFRSRGWTR